jgi:transposase-like protein
LARRSPSSIKSTVRKSCEEIDSKVKAFIDRPIEGDWPCLGIDAGYVKARDHGRIVSAAIIGDALLCLTPH